MILPEGLQIVDEFSVELASLVLGQQHQSDENFFAISAEFHQTGAVDPTSLLVVLSATENRSSAPYLISAEDRHPGPPRNCINLGTSWSLDCEVSKSAPKFSRATDAKLVLCAGRFFVPVDGMFLDVRAGKILQALPDRPHVAWWTKFVVSIADAGGNIVQIATVS